MSLPIDGWMVAWKPHHPGTIAVGPWPDSDGWSRPYRYTAGCCFSEYRDLPMIAQVAQLFTCFHTLVVRDGIDPQAAHGEFLKIGEYRRRISPDIAGAL